MVGNMQIIFDFKNLKEYISSYTLEQIDDKKIRVTSTYPRKENIGTFLLEFMNTDFDDPIDLSIFVKNHLFVHLLTIYANNIIEDITNYSIVIE